jgi:hypothetical protein
MNKNLMRFVAFYAKKYSNNYDDEQDLIQEARIFLHKHHNATKFQIRMFLIEKARAVHGYPEWLIEVSKRIKSSENGFKDIENGIKNGIEHIRNKECKRINIKEYVPRVANILRNLPVSQQFDETIEYGTSFLESDLEVRDLISKWSEKEQKIVALLLQGINKKEIRERLSLTYRQYTTEMSKIKRKVGAHYGFQ